MVDLVAMLGFAFMRRALLAGLCVGVVAPLVGSFLVHRRMAFIGDTLAHTAFAGVAVGLFIGSTTPWEVSPTVSALVVAVIAALSIEVISSYTGEYGDVSMAIVLFGGFALGTVLVSLSGGISVSINQYLFGSISTVSPGDARLLVVLTLVVVAVVAVTYKQLLFVTADEEAARVARIDVPTYNRLLVVLTAAVVVAAMQILGVILVAAMLVVPVAAATHLAGGFKSAMLLAVAFGQASALIGITLSYGYGLAGGGTIVLVAIGLYGLAGIAGGRVTLPP